MKLSRIIKDYRESGAFNSLIGVHAAINDHAFLTKGGDIFAVLRVKGIDFEGRDPAELDHHSRRFEAAVRTLGDDCRLQQYVIKRSGVNIPFEPHSAYPVLAKAVRQRMEFLAGKVLYDSDVYWVVTHEVGRVPVFREWFADPLAALQQRLSTRASRTALDARLRRAEERLREKVTSLVTSLQDSIQPVLLDKQASFTFLRRLLNFSAPQCDGFRLKYNQFVDYQACGSNLEGYRDHLRLGNAYVRVLTLKEPPARTFAHMLRQLHEIGSDFIIANDWKPASNDQARSLIQSKRRHFHNSKASLLNYVSSNPSPDVLIDDSASAIVKELGTCLEEIEVRHHRFGQFSMTLVLHDTDFERLKRSVAEAVKLFAAQDAQVIEEHYNTLNAYLATIPGNTIFNLRRLWLMSPNYADLSFLFTVHSGEAINDHLQSEYLAVLETDHGTPYGPPLRSKVQGKKGPAECQRQGHIHPTPQKGVGA